MLLQPFSLRFNYLQRHPAIPCDMNATNPDPSTDMEAAMAQYLFLDTDVQVLINLIQCDLLDEVDHLSDTAILSRSNEERLKHSIDEYTISVPTLDVAAKRAG